MTLTAPSTHFCKFWGYCPFFPTHFFRRLQRFDLHEIWYDNAHWASEPDRKLKFSTYENPRWRSLTDEHLTEQHWQPVFLFSKPIVSIHVCCSYIELSRSKPHFMLGIDALIANIQILPSLVSLLPPGLRTASTDFCLHRFFWATRFLILFFPYFFVSEPCAR